MSCTASLRSFRYTHAIQADCGVSRFRQKFKSFIDQYELRELHFLALQRTKESEVQLSFARAEEQRKRAEIETTKARTLSAQVSTFSQTETELRSQLNIYVEKFKQVRKKKSFVFSPDSCSNLSQIILCFNQSLTRFVLF